VIDQQIGAVFRAVRIRRRMRQEDVAAAARVARSWVSRVEHGRLDGLTVDRLRAIAAALEIRVEIVATWRGAGGARVVNERHSRMHELIAAHLSRLPGWEFAAEVSFSRYGERGVIDILAWHAASRTLLVIEIKTEIPDPAGLVAQVNRYRRLAPAIARERGWNPAVVATWVLVANADMNRRQLARHRTMLRNAFPLDGRAFRSWLRDPAGAAVAGAEGAAGSGVTGRAQGIRHASGLGFLAIDHRDTTNGSLAPTRRVRRPTILVNAREEAHLRGNRAPGAPATARIGLGDAGEPR